MSAPVIARTLILQNYFAPAADLADIRRGNADSSTLVSAMKRTELANTTLENELNAFTERGYTIISIIPHPMNSNYPYDLLLTIVLSEDA